MSIYNLEKYNKFSENIGKRLKIALIALGIKTSQIPELAGVSTQQWAKYQRGESEPGITKIKFLFDCGVSPAWLYTGEGPMMTLNNNFLDPELLESLQDPGTQTLVKGILLGLKAKDGDQK